MSLPRLNLPEYTFRFKKSATSEVLIFDFLRKKWMVLTPEEWVRQNFNRFLIDELNFPATLFKIETGLKVNQNIRRSDALIYKNGNPFVLVEYKSPKIVLNQSVLNQALNYNKVYKCPYVIISNGLKHLFFSLKNEELTQLSELLDFNDLLEE